MSDLNYFSLRREESKKEGEGRERGRDLTVLLCKFESVTDQWELPPPPKRTCTYDIIIQLAFDWSIARYCKSDWKPLHKIFNHFNKRGGLRGLTTRTDTHTQTTQHKQQYTTFNRPIHTMTYSIHVILWHTLYITAPIWVYVHKIDIHILYILISTTVEPLYKDTPEMRTSL